RLDGGAPFEVDLAPLREVARDVFGLLAPARDAEPGGDVLLLAGLVALPFVRRHRELADGRALRCVGEFGVAPEVADDDDLVERHVSRSVYLLDAASGELSGATLQSRHIVSHVTDGV